MVKAEGPMPDQDALAAKFGLTVAHGISRSPRQSAGSGGGRGEDVDGQAGLSNIEGAINNAQLSALMEPLQAGRGL